MQLGSSGGQGASVGGTYGVEVVGATEVGGTSALVVGEPLDEVEGLTSTLVEGEPFEEVDGRTKTLEVLA